MPSLLSKLNFCALLCFLTAKLILVSSVFAEDHEVKLEYNRDIRPILAENCFSCHGPDSAARQAGLRLDQREAAVDFGVIVPGDTAGSPLIDRILKGPADDELMPPLDSHKKLTDDQKELLKRWVAAGAQYQPHWAFIVPEKSALPVVKDTKWPLNEIDYFVLAKLEEVGLSPANEAERYALVRRVALDVTGLPPSVEVVQQFVNNDSPDAYEKLIDQLMESPAWGEHRARYWLDVARYADTHGIHFDNFREVWAYRDWVIQAFNANQPFDQFTIDQLAGDMLPARTVQQQVATGFNRCNITTNEGGIIDQEYEVLYARDRTETTAQTWMGLTVGCAVCHDHKFDPFSQKEFYELSAFFNNTTQAVRDGNIKETPPTVFVPSRVDDLRWGQVQESLANAQGEMHARSVEVSSTFEDWLKDPKHLASLNDSFEEQLLKDLRFQFPAGPLKKVATARVGGADVELEWGDQPDATQDDTEFGDFSNSLASMPGVQFSLSDELKLDRGQAFSFGTWVKFQGNNNSGALFASMQDGGSYRGWDLWSEDGRVGTHLIHDWPSNALKVVTRDPIASDKWTHVFVTYDGSSKAGGVRVYVNGKSVPTSIANDSLTQSIEQDFPLTLFQRNGGSLVPGVRLKDVLIYGSQLPESDLLYLVGRQRLESVVAKAKQLDLSTNAKLEAADRQFVLDWYLQRLDSSFQQWQSKVRELEGEREAIRGRGTLAHVMNERSESPIAFILNRGEYDQRRDQVSAATPAMLPVMADDLPRNRLGLARWLVSDQHPLTTRVSVNRFWQSVFGEGLVASSGDFGLTGSSPTHPELLDWLSVDFRQNGWDVKRLFKKMLMSRTYRQSAMATERKLALDQANLLLSRGPRFRMDAEMVRDSALAATEVLVESLGGPSVKPYQPPGVWEAVAMRESNTHDYRQDSGEALYRRSLYTFWKRSAPPASMDIFNAPSREVCTVKRERTNTPLQALVTLNDPQFIEAGRVLASQVLGRTGAAEMTVDEKIDWLTLRILARTFSVQEKQVANSVLEKMRQYYSKAPEQAAELVAVGETKMPEALDVSEVAAWTMLVNQLLNLDEALSK